MKANETSRAVQNFNMLIAKTFSQKKKQTTLKELQSYDNNWEIRQ